MSASIESCHALVLNADYRPLNYFPLSLWPWHESVKAVFMKRVNVVSEYEQKVHSPTLSLNLPSVVALKNYVPPVRKPAFTRFNVFLRDNFMCQYCGNLEDLTFDHLVPKSLGGRTTWINVVTACSNCNFFKGGRLEKDCKMHPRIRPHIPSMSELQENGRKFPPNYLHKSWHDFLYWDIELEP